MITKMKEHLHHLLIACFDRILLSGILNNYTLALLINATINQSRTNR